MDHLDTLGVFIWCGKVKRYSFNLYKKTRMIKTKLESLIILDKKIWITVPKKAQQKE